MEQSTIDALAAKILAAVDGVPQHSLLIVSVLGGLYLLIGVLSIVAAKQQMDTAVPVVKMIARRFF